MSRLSLFLSSLAILTFAIGSGGCQNQDDSPPPAQPAEEGSGTAADHEHVHEGEHTEHAHQGESSEYAEQLAKLSDEDRALAQKQKICPVSGEPLGSMGVPCKVTVKDRDVLLCCAGCEDAITEEPEKYLAKLDQ